MKDTVISSGLEEALELKKSLFSCEEELVEGCKDLKLSYI